MKKEKEGHIDNVDRGLELKSISVKNDMKDTINMIVEFNNFLKKANEFAGHT